MVDTVMAKTDLARGCSSGEFIESLFLARSNVLHLGKPIKVGCQHGLSLLTMEPSSGTIDF